MDQYGISVIIASLNSRETISACLESLERQETRASFEVIVVDSSNDGTATLVAELFPWVRLFSFNSRKYCGDARNIGISKARGEIIAFIDADCTASPAWIRKLAEAHEAPDSAIGGAVDNGNPESLVGWGAYFTEFSQWMPGGSSGYMVDIAGANLSYKKRLVEDYGSFIEGTYCSDTEFHWRLEKEGIRLRFDPELVVRHRNIDKLTDFIRHEFMHGRSFARVRVRARRFSRARRIAYALLIPPVAGKILARRIFENASNRVYLKQFLLVFPLVVLGVACWSAGEFRGYSEKLR